MNPTTPVQKSSWRETIDFAAAILMIVAAAAFIWRLLTVGPAPQPQQASTRRPPREILGHA
jgi:hypothetical protein